MRAATKMMLAAVLVGGVVATAWAIEARFEGRGAMQMILKIWDQPDPLKKPRPVGKVKVKDKLAAAQIDGTASTSFTFDADVGADDGVEIGGAIDRRNDRKGVVIADEGDVGAVQDFWDAYVAGESLRKKPTLGAVSITFTSAVPKGAISVKRNFQSAKFKVTYRVEGVIDSGEFTGHPVSGKLVLSMKGSRDD